MISKKINSISILINPVEMEGQEINFHCFTLYNITAFRLVNTCWRLFYVNMTLTI